MFTCLNTRQNISPKRRRSICFPLLHILLFLAKIFVIFIIQSIQASLSLNSNLLHIWQNERYYVPRRGFPRASASLSELINCWGVRFRSLDTALQSLISHFIYYFFSMSKEKIIDKSVEFWQESIYFVRMMI